MKIYFRIFRVVLLFNYQGSRSLSDLFYTDISLSVLPTCCLHQRYISYHFCFSLSRTFLFYFRNLSKNKILEIFLISCFRTLFLIAFCDSDMYLTTSFGYCQELFSFNFIIFKRNQITFRCAISQSQQQIKSYHIFSTMSRTFFHYEN